MTETFSAAAGAIAGAGADAVALAGCFDRFPRFHETAAGEHHCQK